MAALLLPESCAAQHLASSTFDWHQPVLNNWNEGWADVKTPGDGRTYVVGTTLLNYADPAYQQFSNAFSQVQSPVGRSPSRDLGQHLDGGDQRVLADGGSVREPLLGAGGLPPGSFDYYVQFVSMLSQPLAAPCAGGLSFAASPAMVFGY